MQQQVYFRLISRTVYLTTLIKVFHGVILVQSFVTHPPIIQKGCVIPTESQTVSAKVKFSCTVTSLNDASIRNELSQGMVIRSATYNQDHSLLNVKVPPWFLDKMYDSWRKRHFIELFTVHGSTFSFKMVSSLILLICTNKNKLNYHPKCSLGK